MDMNRTMSQKGSVILEALIAILIFSIGILALVGMQATAINNVADSKYRSTAAFLADQMVETIRATSVTVPNASGVMVVTPDPSYSCDPCDALNGNAVTQAWVASGVGAQLPNGTAAISSVGATVVVSVGWQPPSASSGVAAHRHVVSASIY